MITRDGDIWLHVEGRRVANGGVGTVLWRYGCYEVLYSSV